MWEGYMYDRTDGTRKFTRRAAAAAMGERGKMCEERIAQIAAADGNPYKVLRVTEAATHAEIKKAYHKTVLLVRECRH
jgi:DnaJ-class molecular chaperone